MDIITEKFKYLFKHFLSPKEILLLTLLTFFSLFFFLNFLYKGSTYFMTERIMYAGSLTEGIIGSPSNTDPYKADSQADKDLAMLLYGTLIKNVQGEKFDLSLAAKVDVNGDKNIYRVTMRDNLFFSNGTPITVDDVLYSLSNVPLEKNYTVEKTSDKILTFNLKKGETDNFLDTLTYPIVPRGEVFESSYSKNLVTSSFFKIKSLSKDADGNVTNMSLQRYNNGVEKLPYIKYYNINFYKTEVEAYNAFQKKELDLLSGVPGSTIAKIKDDTNIKFETAQLPNNFSIFLNQNKNEILRDNDLRQALSDLIDRESLTNQVLGSFGLPQKNILGEEGVTKSPEDIIKNLSSSFLYENGVLYKGTKNAPKQKSDKTVTDKEPVKIKITTIQNTELVDTAKFIQNAWKKIGVEVDIQIIDRKDLNGVVKDRDFEALLFGFSIKEPKDYYSFFSSKERNYPKLNISNYTSKDVDKILDNLETEKDVGRQQDYVSQLSKIIETDNPVIILYKPQFVFVHFLNCKITLPNTIKDEEDKYVNVENWYTGTEKVLKIFNNNSFINRLDTLLY